MKLPYLLIALLFSTELLAAIPRLEQKDFNTLIKDANNNAMPMTQRWQALVKAGEVANPDQVVKIQEFVKSSDWFMRNASIVSLETININYALDQAKMLIHDKALVVRSAAVNILSKKNSLDIKRLLAAELDKKYNFSGKQSLWIRPQIMKQMAYTASTQDRQFLARYLFDSDKKVAALSAEGLEKISSIEFSGPKRVEQWQNFVKKNGWL